MASSHSIAAQSTASRPTPSTPSTPAQLFYGARGRSGSIASSFARQQAASREQAQSPPPLPPLPPSHSAPINTHHAHSSSISSSLNFPRSTTFPTLTSPSRTTFGSPVRSTFGADILPPIRAGESLSIGVGISQPRPSSPQKSGSGIIPPPRNPSPLGHGHSLNLTLPPSTRGQNRAASGTNTWSSASVHSVGSYPNLVPAEQIPLGRMASKQSREALIGAGTRGGSPSFGAMLFNAGRRLSLTGAREKDTRAEAGAGGEKPVEVVPVNDDKEKEKGWGDSVGGIRSPRESIVKFTRARSRSISFGSQTQGRSSGGESSRIKPVRPTSAPTSPPPAHVRVDSPPHPIRQTEDLPSPTFRPSGSTATAHGTDTAHGLLPRRPQLHSGWQYDMGPVVKDEKSGRIVRQYELVASETRWFCRGHFVTGGGTRRIPVKERKVHPFAAGLDYADEDGWAHSDGTAYAYESDAGPRTGSSQPHTESSHPIAENKGEKREKRNRVKLVPYPFVFSLLLVLGTAGTWIGTTCVWWWRHVSPAVAVIGAWLVLLVAASMARTAFTDPGIVPRNLDLNPVLGEDGTPYTRDFYVRGVPVRLKYCVTCKTYRPLRSSHCRICDNCVDGCDHHCQWVNNCVGRRNYTSFITFLIACFLAILLIAITAALHIYLQTQPSYGGKNFREAIQSTGGGSAAVFIVCAAVVWPVGTLLGYHIRLLALNITTIEQLRNSAHAALAPGEEAAEGPGPNAFSLGRWTRNAAWGACRPAGTSWIEGWKPVRADRRVMLPPDSAV